MTDTEESLTKVIQPREPIIDRVFKQVNRALHELIELIKARLPDRSKDGESTKKRTDKRT